MRAAAIALCLLLCAGGCKRQDMYTQNRSQTWDRNGFFKDGQSMRPPVAGAVPRDAPHAPVTQPAVIDAAMLSRGHERYDIFCTPCHAGTGNGNGMIVQRGFPPPASFNIDRLRRAKASYFYDAITNGYGTMYSYADRVPPTDRWAIIAYIRALQLSQDAPLASLSAQDRAQLEAAR